MTRIECKHEITWDEKIKIMTFPPTKFGYCIKCNRSCKKNDGKITWEED